MENLNLNYEVFFKACRDNVYFQTNKGLINAYDLFNLSFKELKELYIELKKRVTDDNDPLLNDITQSQSEDNLKFEIVKNVLMWRKYQARMNELMKKKRELEKMLREAELRNLKENPDKIKEELEKLNEKIVNF